MQFLYVGLFGVLGVLLRFLISLQFKSIGAYFYIGTFIANILGCFVIGYVYKLSLQTDRLILTAIIIGFCGGLTTFSSFSMDIFHFLQKQELLKLSLYILSSVAVGLLATILGYRLA